MKAETAKRNRRIWSTICDIPPGNVASYGQVAEIAGIPRGARQVGYALRHLPGMKLEIEHTPPNTLLDVESLSRSPSVYKPVLVSDWRGEGRQVLSVSQGMIEWPRPSLPVLSDSHHR